MAMRLILMSFVASSMFVFHQISSADVVSPILSTIWNSSTICDVMACGKGTCKVDLNRTVPFVCECDAGWKQFQIDDSFRFMPCVIPNCTMNYSCNNASTSAATPPPPPANRSFIPDTCTLAYCGEGTCIKTSGIGHKCECANGFANLFNGTNFPCFRECVLGGDCTSLGLGFGNRSSSASPNLSDSSGAVNNACSDVFGNLFWLITLVISLAMVP